MDRKTIIQKVTVKLDEYASFGQGLIVSALNVNAKPIEEYIDTLLDECTEELELTVPIHLLPLSKLDITNLISITDNVATIKLPFEYLKLAYLKFPCWERPINKVISESHPLYAVQKNEYTRGGFAKPVVVIKKELITNKKLLECYTVQNDTTNLSPDLAYIKIMIPDQIPDNLVPVLSSLCAQKVMIITGRTDLANIIKGEYIQMIQLLLNT
jgi:hypothetical protein